MFINELAESTTISISATKEKNTMEFVTELIKLQPGRSLDLIRQMAGDLHYQHYIIVREVMIEEDRAANFTGKSLVLSVGAMKGDKMYLWNNVKIMRLRFPKTIPTYSSGGEKLETAHVIMCNDNVKSTNRRGSYRQWLGIDGSLQFIGARETYKVLVKDISSLGIGIIADSNFPIEKESRVYIALNDKMRNAEGKNAPIYLKINATVVRVEKMDDGRRLVGCKINVFDDTINKFIYQKQREVLKGRSGGR